jgi:KUP system potassium uptake protein
MALGPSPAPAIPADVPPAPEPHPRQSLAALGLSALGVVFGDIATSPLYAMRACFGEEYGVPPTPQNVLGILSLITWSLVVVISIKYVALIMRADNNGEGGVLALMALTRRVGRPAGKVRKALATVGLLGAALLYGDGVLTPAISVLSAVEGIGVATPALKDLAVPLTAAILVALFLVQRRGTSAVGVAFGPVTLLWLVTLGLLGTLGIAQAPGVLAALDPTHALDFATHHGATGFLALGGVFLVVTGGEALYADMGHFGRRPIQVTWFAIVLPALLLNYFGQGALLLVDPSAASEPFYRLAPAWGVYPLVLLATCATAIASQAVISGCFSLTRQAVQLGYCPRVRIEHTSHRAIGQIYVPAVNAFLMVASITLAVGFGSSDALAGAYGIAVSTTMVLTTVLFVVAARTLWSWPLWVIGPLGVVLLVVDTAFLGANGLKLLDGGWVTLAIAGVMFTLMVTWQRGRNELASRLTERLMPIETLLDSLKLDPPVRVPGIAVFLTAHTEGVPIALLHNLKHNHVLHEDVVILTIVTVDTPVANPAKRIETRELESGFYRVLARSGFMETPNVPAMLAMARCGNLDFGPARTTYFLGRETVIIGERGRMARWQRRLFALVSRWATRSTAYFNIPPGRVVELGLQVEL